jgi:hypothetical protein
MSQSLLSILKFSRNSSLLATEITSGHVSDAVYLPETRIDATNLTVSIEPGFELLTFPTGQKYVSLLSG